MEGLRSCSLQRVAFSLLLCAVTGPRALADDGFVAISPQQAARYHVDFARHYFASPEAEKSDRAALDATLKSLEALKGTIARSADNLLRALELGDQAEVQFHRHSSYLYLRYAVDTSDGTSFSDSSALDAEFDRRTAFLRNELMQITQGSFASFAAKTPGLKKYRFAVEEARRYRPYTLSLKEEEMLGATAPNDTWPEDLYEKLRADPQTSPDLYAFVLMRLAGARTRLARLRHFPDAPSQAYFDSYWSRQEVDDLLEALAGKADLYKRYERLRASHSRAAGFQPPRYPIDQASEIVRNALAPLGADYGRELAALLDPLNGRMDIVPGEHRKRGGFSQGFIGTDSVFYSAGYAGAYNDVRVLTHESTHAVHRQLMTLAGVSPAYAQGPHYLFEAFAIFSEFLLPDYLYNRETDPLRKQFYLEQFLDGKGMEIFVVAPEVAVEHAVYDGVAKDSIKGQAELDALTKRIYSRYSILSEARGEADSEWMKISLMYEDPFYDVNYIYGSLLALKFYELYRRNPEQFVSRYGALLRNGFDAPPADLLKRFLDIDLKDPRLVSDACGILEEKVALLEGS